MADELSFLDAIRAQTEDSAVRLIYADWLEEHGQQARAEADGGGRARSGCVAPAAPPAPDSPEALLEPGG